ncbi:hypothetical protein SK128_005557 [Halocaridina rubra]|uniref:Uncharacterized protein n=1 Tax=Halocaridina rubra TaxID=373956 RepID=A0AAN8X1W9_HALRR
MRDDKSLVSDKCPITVNQLFMPIIAPEILKDIFNLVENERQHWCPPYDTVIYKKMFKKEVKYLEFLKSVIKL